MQRDFEEALASYNLRRRGLADEPFCHAPFTSMHFAHGGSVFVCCHNRTYTIGTYPADSVAEMWNGERATRLRRAVAQNDLSRGCQTCARQLLAKDFVGLDDTAGSYSDGVFKASWLARSADSRAERLALSTPRTIAFEVHNSCNLECVMCHGVASSSIRKNRDALPALSSPYDDAFLDQLSPFLPEVNAAGFTGGEPFLIPFYYELWERIAATKSRMVLMLVTNGTILNERVRRVVESLSFAVNVSVDSIVKETYEKIRVGSSLDLVLANSRYFADVMRRRGYPFIWRCCVMRQNWQEMPGMVRYCSDNGIRVVFNQVDFPLGFSLHTLPQSELREVVAFLRQAEPADGCDAVGIFNQQQYRGLVSRLEAFSDRAHWQNALLDRLDHASSNPMINRVSNHGISGRVDGSYDDLAEALSTYVTTRLTIDQAAQAAGHDIVPAEARNDLTLLSDTVGRLRARVPTRDFLRVYLNVAVRTYVKIMGTPADHTVLVFDRIPSLVESIMDRSERDQLVDAILASPAKEVYRQVASAKPVARSRS
jgi:MoaA/NifB/PqqE/SkfB family radical SAM enzyme